MFCKSHPLPDPLRLPVWTPRFILAIQHTIWITFHEIRVLRQSIPLFPNTVLILTLEWRAKHPDQWWIERHHPLTPSWQTQHQRKDQNSGQGPSWEMLCKHYPETWWTREMKALGPKSAPRLCYWPCVPLWRRLI